MGNKKIRNFQVNDFVFVNPDRGRTPGIARVVEVFGDVATILYSNGEKDSYYFAHLYSNIECVKAKIAFLKKRSEKFGKKKARN